MPGIKKNFLYNSAYQILNIIIPLITTPYLSRVLGPEQVGIYSYTYSITYYFVLFATCGMSTYGVRAVAQASDDRARKSRVFWSAYVAQAIISGLVIVAYALYIICFHAGGIEISIIWGAYVISTLFDVSWLLFGSNDFRIPTIRSALVRVFQLAAVFIFVREDNGLTAYITIYALGFLINQLIIWPFVGKYVDEYSPSWNEVKEHFIPNIKLFVPVVAVSLYTTLDKIMLGAMSNMEQAGYFEYAEKISRLPLTAITALGTVMLPRMSELVSRGESELANKLIYKSALVMLAAAFLFSFEIIAAGDVFVPVYLGNDFVDSIPLVIIMSSIIPIISITNIIGKQYMLPNLMDTQYTLSLLIGATTNIGVNLCLIPEYGAFGASIGTVSAEMSVLIAQALIIKRRISFTKICHIALPYLCIGVLAAMVARACRSSIIALFGLTICSLGCVVAVCGAVYFAGLAALWLIAKYIYKNR